MKANLQIDFGSAQRRATRAGWVLLAMAVIGAGATAAAYHRVERATVGIEARLAALAAKPRGVEPGGRSDPAEVSQLRRRAERAVLVVAALERPWIRLFDDVEAAGVAGISLLVLEPDADKDAVRIAGEAVDRDTLSRYLERLGEATSLREVRLSQHEWQQRGAGSVLRFVISARWSVKQ